MPSVFSSTPSFPSPLIFSLLYPYLSFPDFYLFILPTKPTFIWYLPFYQSLMPLSFYPQSLHSIANPILLHPIICHSRLLPPFFVCSSHNPLSCCGFLSFHHSPLSISPISYSSPLLPLPCHSYATTSLYYLPFIYYYSDLGLF